MKTRSKFLESKHPIVIDVDMAVLLGVNETIVLKQLNYWLQGSASKVRNGRHWVYNSYTNWQKDNFPFWAVSTIKRTISKLEKQGLVISANYNKAGFDKTKWYSIDYDKLDELMNQRLGQNEPTSVSSWTDGAGQNEPTNTRDYTEITTENNLLSVSQAKHDDVPLSGQTITLADDCKEIVDYLNQKTGSQYRATTPKTKSLIKARIEEGFTPADFKKVIDNKVADWGNDERMRVYLRPVTLFGTKFESYLNEQPKNVKSDDDLPDYLKMF